MQTKEMNTGIQRISGNLWISFHFLMILFAIIAFGSIIIRNELTVINNPIAIVVIVFFAGIIIIRSILQLYYFEINEEKLLVKHHLLPWIKQVYYIKDIETATIALVRKQSTQLTIAANGIKTRSYPSGPLSVKDWNRLSELLKERGIQVVRKSY